MKKTRISLIFTFLCFLYGMSNRGFSQTILLGPQEFNSDVIIHGSTGLTSAWFAPDYYTPIDYYSLWGCTGGYAGYSGSFNNYWMNFLRTPEVNCTGNDSVTLSFDLSNSYFSNHVNDKVYFNMWIDGAYHDASTNQTIYFNEARNCVHFDVVFILTPYTNKHVLFYLNTSCGYNDSEMYLVKFDNISIVSPLTTELNTSQSNSETITVFPNPSSNVITIQFPNPEMKEHSLLIYNALGKRINKIENITGTEVKADNRSWQGGLYFFQLLNDNKIIEKGTFVVQ